MLRNGTPLAVLIDVLGGISDAMFDLPLFRARHLDGLLVHSGNLEDWRSE